MTDEQRQKLCKDLRESEGWYHSDGILMEQAADEIERLEKENKELSEHLDWLDSVALGKPS